MRIARALAQAGVDSRRKCEVHVTNGAVKVNGEVVRDLGRQVDVENDAIMFRGKLLFFETYVYFVLFKPEGFMTTASDPNAKKTVYELLPKKLVSKTNQQSSKRTRVFPVGRLDKDSCGLLLFTNDGDFSNKLTHPRYGVSKWYEVRLDRPLEFAHRKQLLDGVRLYDGKAKAQKLYHVSKRKVRIMIKEGKKREVRRMFAKVGYTVQKLTRTHFGPLDLGTLQPGEGYYLKPAEAKRLKEEFNTPAKPTKKKKLR